MNAADREIRARLEARLDAAERRGGHLSFDELRDLAHLYRLGSAQLALLRSRRHDPEAMRYLNALCVRAYTHLQVAPMRRETPLRRFYFARLPATLAATAWMQALLAVVLLAGALTGATLVAHDPGNIYAAIPSAMYPADNLERLVNSHAEREKFLERTPVAFGIKSIFSASLFVHNTGIGFLAFATGILAGVPTIILVFYNGITLGAFAWIFSRDANRLIFWAWLLPHAIPELLAIVLCAVAGLLVARAVLAPGRIGVAAALQQAAGPALELVIAAVPLFVVAAML
ncbi:MAG TPA: stage II sporulation protein M, partial [Candidatus Binataceae bacterium]|nr:stage II sporulation protein M [Candidatus Binataceae bacterium]